MKQKHFIDSHKGITGLAVLAMMAWHGAWDQAAAWLYLALHGSYGLFWILKSRLFGDRSWEAPCGLGYGLVIWAGLSLYWIAPWLLMSRAIEPAAWLLALCVGLYALGVFLHFSADMQKHLHMKYRPGKLLNDGLWARSRNPNYLGELLIYGSFVTLPLHWAPPLILLLFFSVVWLPNMRRKDRSLARYPEFAEWKARSGLLFPRLLPRRGRIRG
ncbi:DUF1295 domain-containing protein [Gammaproteobacteria bacterium AB-CW1]|uniref:DUF1295 domain-containing protein n=1 Tax=Natronospira elongata TaxID=3110268 RepID=A0AAP6MKX0_9GAMM|nr:DUF1295 domain-containing protein [Gammaproteobacteria bacterium AB-CW1]